MSIAWLPVLNLHPCIHWVMVALRVVIRQVFPDGSFCISFSGLFEGFPGPETEAGFQTPDLEKFRTPPISSHVSPLHHQRLLKSVLRLPAVRESRVFKLTLPKINKVQKDRTELGHWSRFRLRIILQCSLPSLLEDSSHFPKKICVAGILRDFRSFACNLRAPSRVTFRLKQGGLAGVFGTL